jgi:hypothetical protein
MAAAATLEHISLTTGSARRSPRSEVSDQVVEMVRKALANSQGRLPGGWSIKIVPAPQGYVYDLLHDGRRVSACFLCPSPTESDAMWQDVSQIPALDGAIRHRPASTPWLAVALVPDVAILANPLAFADVLQQASDLERVVAWTLME